MRTWARATVEVCLLALLAAPACLAPGVTWSARSMACVLAGLALLFPRRIDPDRPGMPGAQIPAVLAALLWLGNIHLEPGAGLAGWWPLVPAGLACLAGALLLLARPRARRTRWGQDLGLAGLLALGLASASALLAHGLLAVRSTAPMAPGSWAWLWTGLLVGAAWLGLDGWARGPYCLDGPGLWGRLRARRLGLSVLAAVALEATLAPLLPPT